MKSIPFNYENVYFHFGTECDHLFFMNEAQALLGYFIFFTSSVLRVHCSGYISKLSILLKFIATVVPILGLHMFIFAQVWESCIMQIMHL